MFRAFLPLFFLFGPVLAWAQQGPPPDTGPARERHRLKEKEAAPAEGPWGPEQIGLTWNDPVWRGLFVTGGYYSGTNIELNVPRGVAFQQPNPNNPPIFEYLDYQRERFRTIGGGVTADFDAFRLSAFWFDGTFDAVGTVTYDDPFNQPATVTPTSVHGNAYGFRVGLYWPAFRYRDSMFEASIGPIATVGWMHQEVTTFAPTPVFMTGDTTDQLTGSLGPKLSLRALFGRFSLEANAEWSYTSGPSMGWTVELTGGIGYKF